MGIKNILSRMASSCFSGGGQEEELHSLLALAVERLDALVEEGQSDDASVAKWHAVRRHVVRAQELANGLADLSDADISQPMPTKRSAPKRLELDEETIALMNKQLVEHAMKYVEDNMARSDFSVEELSRELKMSRVYLYKKLLTLTGKPPVEFIRSIRMQRAARLLRESKQNISEIANQVGISNPKYFSKYFKEEFGVLPSVYQDKKGSRSEAVPDETE